MKRYTKRFLIITKEDKKPIASVYGLNEIDLNELDAKELQVIDTSTMKIITRD